MRFSSRQGLFIKSAVALVGCIVLYSVIVFFLLPPIIKQALVNYVDERQALELRMESVVMNPFTLRAHLKHVRLENQDRSLLLDIPDAHVNFSPAGLFGQPLTGSQLTLYGPRLLLAEDKRIETGFLRWAAPVIKEARLDAGPPPIWVNTIRIRDGSMDVSEGGADSPARVLSRIEFYSRNLISNQESSEFRLSFSGPGGGEFLLQGNMQQSELTGEGDYVIQNFNPAALPPWFRPNPVFDRLEGNINSEGSYAFSFRKSGFTLDVTDSTINVREFRVDTGPQTLVRAENGDIDLDVRVSIAGENVTITTNEISVLFDGIEFGPTGATDTIGRLRLSAGGLSNEDRAIHIASLDVSSAGLALRLDPSGRWHWPAVDAVFPEAVKRAQSLLERRRFRMDEFVAQDSRLTLTDDTNDREVALRLGDIELSLRDFEWQTDRRALFDINMSVENTGRVTADGWFAPKYPSFQVSLTLDGVGLEPFNAYLNDFTPLDIAAGRVSGELLLQSEESGVSVKGGFNTNDLRLAHDNNNIVARLPEMRVPDMLFQSRPLHAIVKKVLLHGLETNVKQVAGGDLNIGAWLNRQTGTHLSVMERENPQEGLLLSIDQIYLRNGRVAFTNHSLMPALDLTVQDMTGGINGLRLRVMDSPFSTFLLKNHPLDFSVMGTVNDNGMARLTGQFVQTAAGRNKAASLVVRDAPVSLLSPYTARYLGRETDSGRFSLDLIGLVNDENLVKGHSTVYFDDFEWGGRVPSIHAKELRLELAEALLRDNNNRIRLSASLPGIPDTAGLNLPAVTARAFLDRLNALVAEPFVELARVTEMTDRPLNVIPFDPGSASLKVDARKALVALSRGLKRRPRLGLGIAAGYDPGIDQKALAMKQVLLHVSLAANIGSAVTDPGSLDFSDPGIQEVLDEFAGERLGEDELAKLEAGMKEVDQHKETYYRKVFAALVRDEEISKTALESLARYRRQAIVRQLEKLGIAPQRLANVDAIKQESSGGEVVTVRLDLMPYRDN